MVNKIVIYKSSDGTIRADDLYFTIDTDELTEMDKWYPEGFDTAMKALIAENDLEKLVAVYKRIVLKAYAVYVPHVGFVKKKRWTKAFEKSDAFKVLFSELIKSGELMNEFTEAILDN